MNCYLDCQQLDDRIDDQELSDVEQGLLAQARRDGHELQHRYRSRPFVLILVFLAGVIFTAFGFGGFHASGAAKKFYTDTEASDLNPLDSSRMVNFTTASGVNFTEYDLSKGAPFVLHYHNNPDMNNRKPIPQSSCPIAVVYTNDEKSAEAVVWNSDSNEGVQAAERDSWRAERPWQKHFIWGAEAGPYRSGLEDYHNQLKQGVPQHSRLYDGEMTYRLNSSVPATYCYDYFQFNRPAVPYERKLQNKISSAFVSNCHPKNARNLFLDELLKVLPNQIDSFGRCKNNADLETTLRAVNQSEVIGQSWWNQKTAALSFYKFNLAIENSNDVDYVTEKFYMPLEAGSVPIVFGAPNMSTRFFPSRHGAIDIADYVSKNLTVLSNSSSSEPETLSERDKQGLQRLADRLKHLASEEGREEYEQMLAWKLDENWRVNSPLGKIVKMTRGLSQDCKLAGIVRGKKWAQSGWQEPQ